MNNLRQEAIRLRLKGRSFSEIYEELGIAKSTLSGWLKDVVLSDGALLRLQGRVRQGTLNGLVKRNKLQTAVAQKRAGELRSVSKSLVIKLNKKDLLLLGAALYWAEGYKRPIVRYGRELTSHSISFVNADPHMIKAFVSFLKVILNIPSEKIILYMRLYPQINELHARRYWKGVTGLPSSCFRKASFLITNASKGHRPSGRLPYGTLQIHVADTAKFHTLMGFIEGVKKQF